MESRWDIHYVLGAVYAETIGGVMTNWTAEMATDPSRGHQLHVELLEGGAYRARLYEDENGRLQLRLYDGLPGLIPVEWLMGIIARFRQDLQGWHRQTTK
jgi:hypothetical protein